MTSSETVPLGEDQQPLRDILRGFLADQLPPAALRAALETKAGYSPELHARLASEFGLTGLTIPREFGGLGLSVEQHIARLRDELLPLAERCGRAMREAPQHAIYDPAGLPYH